MSGSLEGNVATGLQINVVYDASVDNAPPAFKTSVAAAVAYLESQFSTPIAITIDVGYGEVNGSPLGSSLGRSEAFGVYTDYQILASAVTARTSTADEIVAAASLPVSDPTGGGEFFLSIAQAEALGLVSAPGESVNAGAIGISDTEPFTYGTTNGAASGTYDAVGIIEHEITEVLGRDEALGSPSGTYTLLDLFRYEASGVRDLTPGPGFFSIDGTTLLAQFNDPTANDEDAGDWVSSVTDDSFDAFSSPGVANILSATDVRVMDVLGYTPVPTVIANVLSFAASPAAGDLTTGNIVALTVTINRAVTTSDGTPTLLLNDGGTATYDAGQSNGNALVFDYVVGSGQTTTALAVTGLNTNGAIVRDASGDNASFPATQATLPGLEINVPLVAGLNFSQQLELIYIGYFNHAADGPGFNFWSEQNAQARSDGQSASTALTNIANSFMPQPQLNALYPLLAVPEANLTTPAAQNELAMFVDNIYQNLFDRMADAPGAAYWLNQIDSEAVAPGAAILAIANGATGSDSTELQNKITVALDFTTRTNAAGLGGTSSSSFVSAAHDDLSGIDGTSLNDASVIAGMNATTAYIAQATTSTTTALATTADTDPISVSASNSVIDPGAGSHMIQFLADASADTVVLHRGGTDRIAGFNLGAGDVLDLRSLFAETKIDVQDVLPNMASYFSIATEGADAALLFDPLGQGGGTAVAVLQNLGGVVTDLSGLTSHNAILV